ncbi:MAG TPA: cell envelope integrity protein TolA [Deltaproteobacteria bacterium]|nr:cell envelope integrity protein TolA [Deltaproteobacteria bacterium]
MEGLLRGQSGLHKALAGSIIFHAVILSAGLFLFEAGSKRDFLAPVYTVEIVAPSGESARASTQPSIEPQATADTTEAKGPAKEEKKTEAKAEKVRIRESASVSDALKKVEERVRKKTEAASVSSKIEEIKKRQEERAVDTGKRLSELKKELGAKSAVSHQPQAGPTASSTAIEAAKGAAKSAKGPAGAGGGTATGGLKSRYPAYYSIIHDRVKDNWEYPEGFDYKKVSVIVSIKIDRSGSLLELLLEESSGNKRFDESLMNAVQKAAPFPPLPHEFEGKYLETGLRFCPGCAD